MEHFFKLHSENIIGYKALTRADLGLSVTSHQTHIGLFDDVLTYLPNLITIDDLAMFIYDSNVEFLNLNFNRIQNSDGSYRSPKITTGGKNSISLVSTIREIVKRNGKDTNWFLFWFGLESGQVVFWLFNNDSQAYDDITKLGLPLNSNSKGRITIENTFFLQILSYIEHSLDKSTEGMLKDFEIETQIAGKLYTKKNLRKYDIKRVQDIFIKIGKQGEELVAEFFERLKNQQCIKCYNWVNENSESGNPFDFYYQDLSDNVVYLDVKTTKFDFEQKIIYSDKEINFALTQPKGCYNIYRVYDLTDSGANLRICKDCAAHFSIINDNILKFQTNLKSIETDYHSINIAFQPNIKTLNFESKITLEFNK